MTQVFFSSLNVLIIFLKRASGAHLDRIGSNWRLRAPDTLGEFQRNFKNREHLELIWGSSGSDWIGSDPIGGCELQMLSENFKKIQKNREHLELIWSSYRWDVPTFWTLSAWLAYFLFHAILKNKKTKLEEIGRKWCRTFETNLRYTLLKKLDISKIAVLKEFTNLKTGF